MHGRIAVDHVIRYENIEHEAPRVFARLGLPSLKLPRLNVSDFRRETISPFVRKMVARYYSDDYRLLGYSPVAALYLWLATLLSDLDVTALAVAAVI
jgi:hypothetical protein